MTVPNTVQERRELIKKELKKYIGESYDCPALNCKVKVISKSVKETANWAALSVKSAKLCLKLPYIIKHAQIEQIHLPVHSKKQIKTFNFIEIANLVCHVPFLGKAKLTIGFKRSGDAIEYCITEFVEKR